MCHRSNSIDFPKLGTDRRAFFPISVVQTALCNPRSISARKFLRSKYSGVCEALHLQISKICVEKLKPLVRFRDRKC
jgi:hypothetical protein